VLFRSEAGSEYWFDPIESGLIDSLGDFINLGSELKAQILYYSPKPVPKKTDINNTSIVLRIQYNGKSFLFMGDAEKYVETKLIKQYSNGLQSTVLKVGHHGSKTASSTEFLDKVKPEYAVVMAGRGKFSGTYLPNQEVIDELENHNIHILRTDYQDENKKETQAGGDDNIIMTVGGSGDLHLQTDQN
jgi:beta-lactamase superfamily II metal-dependent hydrolase